MTEFPLKLDRELRGELVRQVQQYLRDNFDLEAGDLASGLLLDFAGQIVGPLYYNNGLRDALAAASRHAEALEVDVFSLERPVNPRTEPRG